MGISRVDYAGETLVDLTNDTVNKQVLFSGYTAHGADGEPIEGGAIIPTKVSELENDARYISIPETAQGNRYLRDDGTWVAPSTNLLATEPGIPLDQTMGKQLKDDIDAVNSNLLNMFKIRTITRHAHENINLQAGTFTYTVDLAQSTSYMEYVNAGYIPYVINVNVYSTGKFAIENLIDFGTISNNKIRVRITAEQNSKETIRTLVLWEIP